MIKIFKTILLSLLIQGLIWNQPFSWCIFAILSNKRTPKHRVESTAQWCEYTASQQQTIAKSVFVASSHSSKHTLNKVYLPHAHLPLLIQSQTYTHTHSLFTHIICGEQQEQRIVWYTNSPHRSLCSWLEEEDWQMGFLDLFASLFTMSTSACHLLHSAIVVAWWLCV